MVVTTHNVPDEILAEILGKLPKKDLKNARLVYSLWSTAGAKWMFRRVYFAPRKASMQIFTDVAVNPAFARNVKNSSMMGDSSCPNSATFASHYSVFGARMFEEFNVYEDYTRNFIGVKVKFARKVY